MGKRGHAAKRRVMFVPSDDGPERTLSPDEEESTEEDVAEPSD